MVRALSSIIWASALLLAKLSRGQLAQPYPYIFDTDVAGDEECNAIKDYLQNDEDFRLWCINEAPSMKRCGSMCHEALTFPSSLARCRFPSCSLATARFVDEYKFEIDMNEVSTDKVTVVAVVPTYQSYSNYMLVMLERMQKMYPATTSALFLPLDIAIPGEYNPGEVSYRRGEDPNVIMLEAVQPKFLRSHPLFGFLSSLRLESGSNIDIYTDRPVVFVVSRDGNHVERIVFPTMKTLEESVSTLGAVKISDITVHKD
eukprot:scaffold24005_cov196-Cylindrotheca_fusiformis.AAC.1